MKQNSLHAHSIAEIHLYLMAEACRECQRGPLKSVSHEVVTGDDRVSIVVTAGCTRCDHKRVLTFTLPPGASVDPVNDLYPTINPTDEPSRILDVGQWLVLFRVILEAASKEKRKIEARRLGYEAAQCLAEAIKFYDDNDLPPESAAFTDATRKRLREHPEHFSRQHLISTRAKLPKLTVMKRQIAQKATRPAGKRPWWKRRSDE